MKERKFKHNIVLPNGEMTNSDRIVISDDTRLKAMKRTLNVMFPSPSGVTVADLGCSDGGYSVELAKMGFDVVGIEGRQSRYDNCLFVSEQFRFDNLKFVLDDVKNLSKYGRFDCILCFGLLYHLDNPVAFLKKLNDATGKVLLLETHFSTDNNPEHLKDSLFSDWEMHEGCLGKWYREWSESASDDVVAKALGASVSNSSSFWLSKRDLIRSIKRSGYDIVYEQYDFMDNNKARMDIDHYTRSIFVGVHV